LTKKSTQYWLKNNLVDADQQNLSNVGQKTSLVNIGKKIPSRSWLKKIALINVGQKTLPNIGYKIALADVG